MSSNFNEIKVSLAHFFIKNASFTSYKTTEDDDFYLYSSNNTVFNIVIISNSDHDSTNNIEKIKEKIKIAPRQKINILKIILSQHENQVLKKANEKIIISNSFDSIKKELSLDFPKVSKLNITTPKTKKPTKKTNAEIVDAEEISDEEIIESLKDPSKSNDEKFKKVLSNLKTKTPTIAWIFAFAFAIIPFGIYMYSSFFAGKYAELFTSYGAMDLAFGGLDHNLTTLSNQWWRILTYGFTSNELILRLVPVNIIVGIALFKITKYTENVSNKFALIIAVILTYLLTGFVGAVVLPVGVQSGAAVPFAGVLGVLCVETWGKKDALNVVSRSKVIINSLMLIIIPILLNNTYTFFMIFAALTIGASIKYLIGFNYKNPSALIVPPVLVLFGFIVVPSVLLIVPTFSPALNNEVLSVIRYYIKNNWIGQKQAQSWIDSIGWNLSVNVDENLFANFSYDW